MKNQINPWLAVLLLLSISCTKEPLQIPSATTAQSDANATSLSPGFYVGEHYGGGVIFFLDSTKQHGLIADTADLGSYSWYNGIYLLTDAQSTRIGAGHKNTKRIILAQGKSGSYAALECIKSKHSGYSDWFLPSKDELNKMYRLRYVIGGFTTSIYWSSSEDYDHSSWLQTFENGKQATDFKSESYLVRAARSF